MAQLDRLMREARKSMRARGHNPNRLEGKITPGIGWPSIAAKLYDGSVSYS
jgi:hypothetical protein